MSDNDTNPIYEALLQRHSVKVVTPEGLRFTIEPRVSTIVDCVRGYSCIKEGERTGTPHAILSRSALLNWTNELTLVEVLHDTTPDPQNERR